MIFLTALLITLHAVVPTMAEPVQYCRFGHAQNEADFCMGVTMQHNHTTSAYDLYLSMSVTRSSSRGWTAIGTGHSMAGSLMFIIYGDPYSTPRHNPIVSIRTVKGHFQPTLVTRTDVGGADLRVLQTSWMAQGDTFQGNLNNPGVESRVRVAKVAAVCYACARWPGSPISPSSGSQPWIWAWNNQQEMQAYTFDAQLDMHAHHAGNGGWGVFYVDMARSRSDGFQLPSFPPLRSGVERLGTSDSPIGLAGLVGSLKSQPAVVVVHAFSLGIAFLFVFPVGVVAMRSGLAKAFRYHWVLQVVASALAGVGIVSGLVMSRGRAFVAAHQWLGVAVGVGLGLQSLLGWRHHVVFLRIRRRTWLSHGHIWLGRLIFCGGWANLVSGMLLSGHGRAAAVLVAMISVEGVGFVLWRLATLGRWMRSGQAPNADSTALTGAAETYFAVGDESDGDESGDGEGLMQKGHDGEKVLGLGRKSMAVDRVE